jgi:phosphoribosylaminoimidazolecarboxamide formyltransferase/IMP cyclohydrolase
MEIKLRYGCNPHQQLARLVFEGQTSPRRVLNGRPSYINILDAFAAWQLARELKEAWGSPGRGSLANPACFLQPREEGPGFPR